MIPALVFLKISGHANVFWCTLAWGMAAGVAAAIGPLQARVVPNLAGAAKWLSRHRDLGPRYLVENTGGNAADTLRSYTVSSILGVAAIGYIQAAGTLMGPFKIIMFGISLVTIPEGARLLRRSPRHLPLFCAAVSIGLTLLALAWGVVLLVALPKGLGHLMLGSIWRPTYPLVLPATLSVTSMCANTGALVGLHTLGAARRSMRAVIFTAVLVVACALVGAMTGGTLDSMRYAAAAAWVGTMVSWWQLRRALHDSDTVPVPGWLWPSRQHEYQPSSSRLTPSTTAASRRGLDHWLGVEHGAMRPTPGRSRVITRLGGGFGPGGRPEAGPAASRWADPIGQRPANVPEPATARQESADRGWQGHYLATAGR